MVSWSGNVLVELLIPVQQVIQYLAAFDGFRMSEPELSRFPVHDFSSAVNPIFQNLLRHIHVHFASMFCMIMMV